MALILNVHKNAGFHCFRGYFLNMTRVQEIRRQAITLSISEKAELAADLLEGLPPVLDDDVEGVAEARRRDAEMDRDPSAAITWEQLRRGLGR